MFEKFTTRDAGDFRQRYQGSYGFFRRGGRRWLVQLVEINNERNPPTIKFVDKDGADFTLVADAPEEDVGFEFLPPRSSWKNTEMFGGVLSKRIVRRQWIRGVHDQNTVFYTPGKLQIPVGFPILNQLFLKEPPKFMDAFRRDSKNDRFTAVSNSFALSPAGEVFCFEKSIGNFTYEDGKFNVALKDKMFSTEINDAFRRNGVGVDVK